MQSFESIYQNFSRFLALTSLNPCEFDNLLSSFSPICENYFEYHDVFGKKRTFQKFNDELFIFQVDFETSRANKLFSIKISKTSNEFAISVQPCFAHFFGHGIVFVGVAQIHHARHFVEHSPVAPQAPKRNF
jgi:hypothetical protein